MKGTLLSVFGLHCSIIISHICVCDSYSLFNEGNCMKTQFECDETKCIGKDDICNSFYDCDDLTDEEGCYCLELNGYVPCDFGLNCISEEEFCYAPDACPEFKGKVNCSLYDASRSEATTMSSTTTVTAATNTTVTTTVNNNDKSNENETRYLNETLNKNPVCKNHATGANCDRCKNGTFNLNEANEDGCITCFCMNRSNECKASKSHRQKILLATSHKYSAYRMSSKDTCMLHPDMLSTNQGKIELNMWDIDFTSSYGGMLIFEVSDSKAISGIKISLEKLFGLNLEHEWKGELRENVEIKMVEKEWKLCPDKGHCRKASREEFMEVLIGLRFINVIVQKNDYSSSFDLHNVTLDGGELLNYSDGSIAREVEECTCPKGYTGTSCQYKITSSGNWKSLVSSIPEE